jgi:hypothetical protein
VTDLQCGRALCSKGPNVKTLFWLFYARWSLSCLVVVSYPLVMLVVAACALGPGSCTAEGLGRHVQEGRGLGRACMLC